MRERSPWRRTECKVLRHTRNAPRGHRTRRWSTLDNRELHVGDVLHTINSERDDEHGIINEIISHSKKHVEWEKSTFSKKSTYHCYRLKIHVFREVWEEETFKSREELEIKWPQFSADAMHDWSKEHGRFDLEHWNDEGRNFAWVMRDGRYSLDERIFDTLPSSMTEEINYKNSSDAEHTNTSKGSQKTRGLGYTDLLLTAEAIRQNAWRLLTDNGKSLLEEFLDAFPDSRRVHEQAIWDSHTSLYAKRSGMSTSDFLRMRALGRPTNL